jgi:uncharacterized delta-60 repeat protein
MTRHLLPFLLLLTSLLCLSMTEGHAQAGANDPNFNPTDLGFDYGQGASSVLYTTVLQPDGKILIGGALVTYNSTARRCIARLNADGSLDTGFNPGTGASNSVYAIALQPDGKIIIGGSFVMYNGTARNYIARLNTDGSLDTGFDPGSGANGYVRAIALQSDGKIIIGGEFTTYSGTGRNYIARLNADGSLDATFDPGSGANGTIQTMALQSDGKTLIGGDFTTYNGTGRNRIARLSADGSLDASFNPGTGANGTVFAITLQPDDKALIGGSFTTYNGTARKFIIRVNANGSLDATFNVGTGAGSIVYGITLQPDGKAIIGGFFTTYNSTARNYIARVNADGSLDTGFDPGSGGNNYIQSIALQTDGKAIIVGAFVTYNGTARNYITRVNADGTLETTFNQGSGANRTILATALQPDGKIIIGGQFNSYNTIARTRIARLNADGSLDATFDPGTGASADVSAITLQPDGKIIIGGTFTTYNGTTRNRIARLNADGSLDATFDPGSGANNLVGVITLQADGKIIIGGTFTTYNGTTRNRIVRLNADGSLDADFNLGTGANNGVTAIVLQSDGKMIIGGNFTTYNGTGRNRVARLNADGTLDTSFNLGTGANNPVNAIALQPDGKIVIGGAFISYNGVSQVRIARLNADGSPDTGFNPSSLGANNLVRTIVLQSDGKIIIGGEFTSYNDTGRNRIARLNTNGSLDTGFDPGTGASGIVYAIALQSNGKAIIGGQFVSYNGTGRNRVARVLGDVSSPPAGALKFDGANDNVLLSANGGAAFNFTSGEVTVEAMVYVGSTADQVIVHRWSTNQFSLEINDNKTTFVVSRSEDWSIGYIRASTTFPTNQWVHVAGVWDGTTISVYENGILKGSEAWSGTLTTSTDDLRIGARTDYPGGNLNGRLDEVRIWDKALCAAEIAERRSCELSGSETGLMAYYNFNNLTAAADENNAGQTVLTDEAGSNNGTLTNFALVGTTSNWTAQSSVVSGACSGTIDCNSINWTGASSTDWNTVGNWNTLTVPTASNSVVISSLPVNQPHVTLGPATPALCNNLTIASGATLTVDAGKALSVGGTVTNAGTILINANATGIGSLITLGTITGAGAFQMEQYLLGDGGATPNGVFQYVSSPVAGATSNTFNALGDNKLWSASEATQLYTAIEDDITPLNVGEGYVARVGANGVSTHSGTAFNTSTINISGLTRTGTTATNRGYNLIGNPYPSSVNWNNATKTNVEPTLWYRTHTSGDAMTVDTYNATSGFGTDNSYRGTDATGIVPPGQGFWVRVEDGETSGSVSFTNAMRSHGSQASIYKQAAEEGTVRLHLSNGSISDETIVYFNTDATDSYDDFDSQKMWMNELPQLYTNVGEDSLTINGLFSIETNTIVDLGYKAPAAGDHTITASSITLAEEVWLEDRLLNTFQHLNQNPVYAFATDAGNIGDRFALHFGMMAVGIGRDAINGVSTHVFAADGVVNVSVGNDITTGTITILDMAGRTVQTAAINGSRTAVATDLTTGIYLVRVETAQGTETHRVMLR